jgi:hypothetical protein
MITAANPSATAMDCGMRLSVRPAEGGRFCRNGIICREVAAMTAAKAAVLLMFFLWHGACCIRSRELGPPVAAYFGVE